ncbi:VanZ family protein [Lacticaseibacillus rhamnosus]|uniref:VanZ family protein n=1 Tax=Lacticaseibacillus rhamnosus TaxID=47715 RepID=UPI0030148319
MSAYLGPVRTAVVTFPFLALLLALPFLVVVYRRYGAFSWWRAIVIYSFVFYLLSAYFLIILPLPAREAVAQFTGAKYNLTPLMALRYFIHTTVFVPSNPHTWLAALKQSSFIQPFFNIVLTIPFGFYLRYYFKRSVPQIIVMSFGLSLFFELTQLSGLYGFYPRPYRLFDVDDLILNTTGGLVGGVLAPILMRALPSRDTIDAKSQARGARVTFARRLAAFLVDFVLFSQVIGLMIKFLFHLLGLDQLPDFLSEAVLPLFFVFVIWPAFNNGQTLGKGLVRIKIVRTDGQTVGFWRLLLREGLLYGLAFSSLVGLNNFFIAYFAKFQRTQINLAALGFFAVLVFLFMINFVWEVGSRHFRFFYDAWADTTQVSTFEVPAKVKQQVDDAKPDVDEEHDRSNE